MPETYTSNNAPAGHNFNIDLAKHLSLQDDNIIYSESAHSRESRHYFKLSVSFTVLSSRLLCITVGFENTSITVPVVSRKSR